MARLCWRKLETIKAGQVTTDITLPIFRIRFLALQVLRLISSEWTFSRFFNEFKKLEKTKPAISWRKCYFRSWEMPTLRHQFPTVNLVQKCKRHENNGYNRIFLLIVFGTNEFYFNQTTLWYKVNLLNVYVVLHLNLNTCNYF